MDFLTKKQAHSYLEGVDLRKIFEEAMETQTLSRDRCMEYAIPEKKFPIFKNLLSELDILTIREGMTAKLNSNLALEEILQRIEQAINSNQK
jgi:O-phosphoseryl-tRNA(Cys) synthetase